MDGIFPSFPSTPNEVLVITVIDIGHHHNVCLLHLYAMPWEEVEPLQEGMSPNWKVHGWITSLDSADIVKFKHHISGQKIVQRSCLW
jgi:hypothetical protein